MRAHTKSAKRVVAVAIAIVLSVTVALAMPPSGPKVRAIKVIGVETGGAVLGLGAPGAFDEVWVTCPTVVHEGDHYLMWYSAAYDSHVGRGGIGIAISRDGTHWVRGNHGRPVLTLGAKGAFDEGQVMGPFVLREKGGYRMWYTGMAKEWHSSGIGFYRIGLATSKDGIHWKRANHGRPVIDVGPAGSYDEVQAATPTILVENGHYRMWYAAWAPKPGHTIATAISSDGVHWQREGNGQPVTGLLAGGQYGPAVSRIGAKYLMLYMRAGGSDAHGLFAATSLDGRTWMQAGSDAVIAPGPAPSFDSAIAGHACLLPRGDQLMAWYTGYRKEDGGYYSWKLRIGSATLALETE